VDELLVVEFVVVQVYYLVYPILKYGCEVWGFGKNEVLERVHLKFCKILLNLKPSTPYYMVYGLWWARDVCQFCTNWSINRCFTTHFNHTLLLTFSVSHIYVNPHSFRKLGDEYHYVLECSSLNDKRKQLLPKYFMKRHNVVKFFELLSTKKQSLLRKLCIFIKHINKVFCTPGLPTVVP
jgi:hypothetical protein